MKILVINPNPGMSSQLILEKIIQPDVIVSEQYIDIGQDVNILLLVEHNKSFSWKAKKIIDEIEKTTLKGSKFFIIGYGGGRFGNVTGIEHMKTVLGSLYVKEIVCMSIPNTIQTLNDIQKIEELKILYNELFVYICNYDTN